jgi:hypothetical protein
MAVVVVLALVIALSLFTGRTPDRGFDWGNFTSGARSGDGVVDDTFNWDSAHVKILRGVGPNGGNAALLRADDSVQLPRLDPGDVKHVRIHGFRQTAKDVHTRWFGSAKPHEVAEAISIRLPPGYDYNHNPVTTLELHGDNGTGPAPFNLVYQVGSTFTLIVRGSSATEAVPGGFPFEQNLFGAAARRQPTGGRFYRRERPFIGGHNVRVKPGMWVNFRLWWHDLSSDPGKGAFTAWVNTAPQTGWRKIADASGIRTADPDLNGDGQATYPMLSLYYDVGGGGVQAVEYAAGRIEPNLHRLELWQNHRLGLG